MFRIQTATTTKRRPGTQAAQAAADEDVEAGPRVVGCDPENLRKKTPYAGL